MAPSQLKQLKASLREGGVLGPQKSKKQRRQNSRDVQQRQRRNATLEGIRECFNPFEAKAPARKDKFDIASNRPVKEVVERPGVTRGLGEERRRATLLKEMQARNKVGGMVDRRFGEDDPNMTPEQKAAERFARQAIRTSNKGNMFNLEDDSGDELQLTHGGRALQLDEPTLRDDFEESLSASEAEDFEAQDGRSHKRVRLDEASDMDRDEDDEDDTQPARKKSKKEVMQEVIAKSKAYKAARQAAKEDDDELRLELDRDMSTFYAALKSQRPPPRQLPSPPVTDSEPVMDPSRAAMLAGKSREEAEREYEANVRELKIEARSKPSVRTKTDEEIAAEEKERLLEEEKKRLKRMRGEVDSSDEESLADDRPSVNDDGERDDAEEFGLSLPQEVYRPNLDVEDEDEFVMDDIIASESDADAASDQEDTSDDSAHGVDVDDDGDDDFINGLVLPPQSSVGMTSTTSTAGDNLPFTYPCPQDLSTLLQIVESIPAEDIPTVVQRIRALYHKGLAEGNGERLDRFAAALTDYIPYAADRATGFPLHVIEQLIRHLHSMAKNHTEVIALTIRNQLRALADKQDTTLSVGNLIMLTGVSTIFPTSDQWHTVVTPSMLTIARFLAQSSVDDIVMLMMGAYCCSLALRYQKVSKRYVPEVVNYINKASLRVHQTLTSPDFQKFINKQPKEGQTRRKLNFQVLRSAYNSRDAKSGGLDTLQLFEAVLYNIVSLIKPCINLWSDKTALPEIITSFENALEKLSHNSALKVLGKDLVELINNTITQLNTARTSHIASRKPLFLHRHRPLAIKSAYPAYSESYNPLRRQRDPDEERAELNRLRQEHRKEKKGAMRELRKDANFMAREQLREKKAKDEAYDKKFKRLVAEIQGEEGRESKEYEKEKRKRKAAKR